ncbi:cyclic pyranopterin monophosphate synthase MoaC [Candidatus Woesearchaeota archaeon]|nr:cyclic pyranopterin monophosphate synthase MoaC [Candidatus Woesearchaeota archaeon]
MGMADVSGKKPVLRTAVAEGKITLGRDTVDLILSGDVKKGDPLAAAEIAAILAVKKTPELIPHCHQIAVEDVSCEFKVGSDEVYAKLRVAATAKTGVEMEALVGVAAALATVWDMVKYLEKDADGQYPNTMISGIRVKEKAKRL